VPHSRGLHHLDLVVSDLERSRKFYSELLRPLGWGPVLDLAGERGEEIWYLQACAPAKVVCLVVSTLDLAGVRGAVAREIARLATCCGTVVQFRSIPWRCTGSGSSLRSA
jgi:catechol 2,3-dioxygenase-like lactoylglutathione lyase family enzyme